MLTLSTKGRYAVRILVSIAARDGDGPVRKHEIAAAEVISPDYVEQILVKLKSTGLVRSHRGPRGGFTLARAPAEIRVLDILQAAEGPLTLAGCESKRCSRRAACVTRPLWQKAEQALAAVLSGTTLADLARDARAQGLLNSWAFNI